MDTVIKVSAAVFIIIFAAFAGVVLFDVYIEKQYWGSLVSTYSYRCTIQASEELTNVTLFVPVPVDAHGSSHLDNQISFREIKGLPSSWETTLLGSSKQTMIKIRTPSLGGPAVAASGTGLSLDVQAPGRIDTQLPEENALLLRPAQFLTRVDCSGSPPANSCYRYQSAIYADYEASPDAKVSVSVTITGTNEWKIFEPASNQYINSILVTMQGEHHGWEITRGLVQAGIGSYDVPGKK